MKLRKFEITKVEKDDRGQSGPDYLHIIYFKAIHKKKWIEGKLRVIAKNKDEASTKIKHIIDKDLTDESIM